MGNFAESYPNHLVEISRRSAQALENSGYDAVIFQAGEPLTLARDDQHYPFKAHPYFKWWLPLVDAPGSLVYFRPGERPKLVFFVASDFWYQPAAIPESWWPAHFDIVTVNTSQQAYAALPQDLSRTAWVGDERPELGGLGLSAINPQDLLCNLDFVRASKTAYEIECLAAANRIAARGHRAAAECMQGGGSEYEIHQAFVAACGQREQELPYNAIVALNEAGSVLHYQVLRRERPQPPRSLLLDAGASFAGYGSDITRTHAHSSADFKALIAAMDTLQLGLCELCTAGTDWREIHLAALERITALLRQAGVLRCSVEEAIASGTARLFFPHGIGHLLGLQVHDVGGTMADTAGGLIPKPPQDPALRLTRTLEPGFVVTMEPGLYFIDALLGPARETHHAARIDWQRVAELAPFGGIRIEDNLVITGGAARNLTREAFADLR